MHKDTAFGTVPTAMMIAKARKLNGFIANKTYQKVLKNERK